jgi:hypothetical protein
MRTSSQDRRSGARSIRAKLLAGALVTAAAAGSLATASASHAAAVPSPSHVTAAVKSSASRLRKGVATWPFTGAKKALAASRAGWYYNWAAAPDGIGTPAGVQYVPMIWGPAYVTPSFLGTVKRESDVLLGFNEPDMGGQANMSPDQALSLWPRLMATGMTLGSPAVASGADAPGGWLDQFMAGVRARHYRVNFLTLHWYGGDFRTAAAVPELKSYIQAVYARYHLKIWLTEFALIGFQGGGAVYPTQKQQAAFLAAATKMLDGLSYVKRYAWFGLVTSSGGSTTGLYNAKSLTVTPVGRAFEAAK